MQQLTNQEKQEELVKKKQEIVAKIQEMPKETDIRRQRIKQLAELTGYAESTLYRFVKQAQQGQRLKRKMRKDTGKTRISVTRKWDKHMKPLLPDMQRQRVGENLTDHIRSLWASGVPGYVTAQRMAQMWLFEETKRLLDITIDDAVLKDLCQVPRSRVEHERKFTMVHIHDKDKKLFHDKFTPNIKRNRDDLVPMQIVCGDVHPIDIGINRDNGTRAYPKAIAWQDMATNRLWVTIKLCQENESVTQGDIAQSYASMVQAWGIPLTLYLDNGKEYGGESIHQSINNLSQLVQKQLNMHMDMPEQITAIPYESQSKPIEGIFSILEQKYFSAIEGHVGGNRMDKKTQNMGKEPKPFPGTLADFHTAIDTALATYHVMPQKGNLAGDSPNTIYQKFIDKGWKTYTVDPQQLLFAFSQRGETRIVGTGTNGAGCITLKKERYYSDRLLEYTGLRLPIVVPKHDPRFLFVLPPGEFPICAVLDMSYDFYDKEGTGAKEKSRRKKELMRIIRDQKRHCDLLDLQNIYEDWVGHQPGTPETPLIGEIDTTEEIKQLAKAYEKALEQPNTALPKPATPSLYGNSEDTTDVTWDDDA